VRDIEPNFASRTPRPAATPIEDLPCHGRRAGCRLARAALLLAAAFPLPALAQPQEPVLDSGPSLAYVALKVILALVVAGGFAAVTVLLMRRFVSPRSMGDLKGEVRLVGTIGLAPKKQIFLVRCFDRLLVVGATESQMTLLSEVTDGDLLATMDRQVPKAGELKRRLSFLKTPS